MRVGRVTDGLLLAVITGERSFACDAVVHQGFPGPSGIVVVRMFLGREAE